MPKTLKLGSLLYMCPPVWYNFIKELRNQGVEEENDDGFSVETLNRELSAFDAHYYYIGNTGYVDFQTESSYVAFLLTYGSTVNDKTS